MLASYHIATAFEITIFSTIHAVQDGLENRKIDYRIVPVEHYTGTLHVGKKRVYGR